MKKAKRLVLVGFAVGVAVTLSGCSGINASRSVSPATFLLPGLIKYETKPAPFKAGQDSVPQVALLVEQEN